LLFWKIVNRIGLHFHCSVSFGRLLNESEKNCPGIENTSDWIKPDADLNHNIPKQPFSFRVSYPKCKDVFFYFGPRKNYPGYPLTSTPISGKCGSFVTTAAPADRADAAMIASATEIPGRLSIPASTAISAESGTRPSFEP
jgi:hypothetical protein